MSVRPTLSRTRRWVVKIGSALLTDNGRALQVDGMVHWAEQMAALQQQGIEIVLVSSGAVAAGMTRLGWQERPRSIHKLQAAAAVGQMGLVQAWQEAFQSHGVHTAQVLLDHDDVSSRARYLNARSTLTTLLEYGVIPVVNENDTMVTDEIRFGDNDTLAAMVANLVDADLLVLLTDQDAIFTADPRSNPHAQPIHETHANDPLLTEVAGDGGKLGRGGMITKVRAAKLAARSGANTVIAGGIHPNILQSLHAGEVVGSLLVADAPPQQSRKQWLAGLLQVRGDLILDDGAVKNLVEQGSSLLPVGVKGVQGEFQRGDLVRCLDRDHNEIARGLINYPAEDVAKILGQPSQVIVERLGYKDQDELIHRDNLVLSSQVQ